MSRLFVFLESFIAPIQIYRLLHSCGVICSEIDTHDISTGKQNLNLKVALHINSHNPDIPPRMCIDNFLLSIRVSLALGG